MVGPVAAARAERRMADAARAFARERYREAAQELRPLVEQAPRVAAVRELYGLALYRLGRWREALRQLEAFRALSGSLAQHPVLADCHRALSHWDAVEELWTELREASPSSALVTEGRIVTAGARADRGDVQGAIRLLRGRVADSPKPVRPHHLRLWYALADLYERAGDVPQARALFARVAQHDATFSDVLERLHALD